MDARRRHPQLRARSGWLLMRYGDLLQAVVVREGSFAPLAERRCREAADEGRHPHFTPSASFTALIVKLPFGPKPMTWPFTMYVGVELMPMSNAWETCSSSAVR